MTLFQQKILHTKSFGQIALDFEPGTKFSYTTFGYTLLGAVIEGASAMKYEDYMRENVFKPAGMQHTYVDDVYALIPNRARGYIPKAYGVFNGENRNASLMDSSYKIPGGGLVSTVEDIARFAIAVQNGVLIKRETFEQMSKSQKTRDGRETGMVMVGMLAEVAEVLPAIPSQSGMVGYSQALLPTLFYYLRNALRLSS